MNRIVDKQIEMTKLFISQCLLFLLFKNALRSAVGVECEYFDSSECGLTNYALKNYGSCPFEACGGAYVYISADACVNFPFLRLVSNNGSLLMNAEDATGECPFIEFFIPEDSGCATYEVHIGCNEEVEAQCEGQLTIDIGSNKCTVSRNLSNCVTSLSHCRRSHRRVQHGGHDLRGHLDLRLPPL